MNILYTVPLFYLHRIVDEFSQHDQSLMASLTGMKGYIHDHETQSLYQMLQGSGQPVSIQEHDQKALTRFWQSIN